jgi:hypothetical protein
VRVSSSGGSVPYGRAMAANCCIEPRLGNSWSCVPIGPDTFRVSDRIPVHGRKRLADTGRSWPNFDIAPDGEAYLLLMAFARARR